ncbi:uncharacterized protein METZ01_LOCUS392008 [marine metagenome]|uniref:Peptidase M41 domain-containing protein n=1 Tax=marine metagenome TaxID=408172 RepID=A0A382UY35_9ZZZZ
MVCEWGMSDKLGPLSFGKKSEEVFLGREISHSRDYSDEISQTIDEEITSFVKRAEDNATSILKEHINELNRIAEALLEYESINGDELKQLVKGEPIIRSEPEKEEKIRRKRRRKNKKTSNIETKVPQNIITKPAT